MPTLTHCKTYHYISSPSLYLDLELWWGKLLILLKASSSGSVAQGIKFEVLIFHVMNAEGLFYTGASDLCSALTQSIKNLYSARQIFFLSTVQVISY